MRNLNSRKLRILKLTAPPRRLKTQHQYPQDGMCVICYKTTRINGTEKTSSDTQPPVSSARNLCHFLHNHQYQQDEICDICYITPVLLTGWNVWHMLHNYQYQQDGMCAICYTTTSINRTECVTSDTQPSV